MGVWRRRDGAVVVVGIVLLLGLAAVPLPSAPTASDGASRALGTVLGPGAVVSAAPTEGAGRVASPGPATVAAAPNASGCAALLAAYRSFYGPRLPVDVGAGVQSPCYIGHDAPALSFLSNASYSGARVAFGLGLPPAGTNPAQAFAMVEIGLWLAGVPCSLGGQSFLTVELIPPYSDLGLPPTANWTVQAPVYSLVPPGSCDPQCQNDTAFFTIGGLAYCEEDVATPAAQTGFPTPGSGIAPGDALTVQIAGRVGGSNGTSVYVNDTTHPAASLAWKYAPTATATGRALTPFYNASTDGASGWVEGRNVEVRWSDCPVPTGTDGPTPCNSYDGPAVGGVAGPTLTSATYWNASTLSYSSPFAWTAATSSSGACSGSAAPCPDYTAYGGTGSYPYWSLHANAGRSWWLLGGAAPEQATDWGGSAGQYAPDGSTPIFLDPTSVGPVSNTTGSGSVSVDARVADPSGVAAVQIGAYFCFGSSTPSAVTAVANLTVSAYDTAQDGNWSTTLGTGSYSGTLYYAVRALSAAGVWTTPVAGSVDVSGTTTCTFPAPAAPTFSTANVTAIAGGYALNWSDPSPGIVDYTVTFNASTGGTPFAVDAGAVPRLFAPRGLAGVPYDLSVRATTADGATSTTGPIRVPAPLGVLTATLAGPTASPSWIGGANVTFFANATGGTAPYTYTFTFSDGSAPSTVVGGASVTVSHAFRDYYGNARVALEVTDADSVNSSAAPILVSIWATPLGVAPSIAAGASTVRVRWVPPVSPAAPVTGYTVFYTENASQAYALTAAWPANTSTQEGYLWNTTATSVDLPVPQGATVWAQVVAWNEWGAGLLPAGGGTLTATAVPLVLGPIVASPGGPAPYLANVSTFVTNGTNDVLLQAIYTAGNSTVNAQILPTVGGVYLNATVSFPTPGAHLVLLHVTDEFYSIAIQLATIYISPGSGPSVVLAPPSTAGWVGWVGDAVPLSASATGGIGPYTYAWQFGDGTQGLGPNTTHVYAVPGTFTVLLDVTDTVTGGVTIATHTLLIYAYPSIAITTRAGPNGSLSVDFGSVIRGGSGPAKVTWSFGDGGTETGANVSHDYASPGTYTVNATATDPSGRTGSTELLLTLVAGASGGGAGGTFLGATAATLGVVLVGVGLLAVVLLGGMVYFWGRARRPPIVMAPEPTDAPDEGEAR